MVTKCILTCRQKKQRREKLPFYRNILLHVLLQVCQKHRRLHGWLLKKKSKQYYVVRENSLLDVNVHG